MDRKEIIRLEHNVCKLCAKVQRYTKLSTKASNKNRDYAGTLVINLQRTAGQLTLLAEILRKNNNLQ